GVVQGDLDRSPVAGVDDAGAVEHGDPVTGGEPRSGAHHAHGPLRQRDGEARVHERPPAGGDLDLLRAGQVQAGVVGVRAVGRRSRLPDGAGDHEVMPAAAGPTAEPASPTPPDAAASDSPLFHERLLPGPGLWIAAVAVGAALGLILVPLQLTVAIVVGVVAI